MPKANDVINFKGLIEQADPLVIPTSIPNHIKIWTAEREAFNCGN